MDFSGRKINNNHNFNTGKSACTTQLLFQLNRQNNDCLGVMPLYIFSNLKSCTHMSQQHGQNEHSGDCVPKCLSPFMSTYSLNAAAFHIFLLKI